MTKSYREYKDYLFTIFAYMSGFIVLSILILVVCLIVSKGFNAISFKFLIQPMNEGGISGGIRYQIIGTFILLATTLLITVPISIGMALLKSFYLKQTISKKIFTLFLYTLNGVPSIIFGIFGFLFFVKFLGWGKSWLTGGILLSMMILPTCVLMLCEGIERIPKDYIENAKTLGLSPSAIVYSVLLPQSSSSFVSGILLGLARAIGETAPIMFAATIFSGATLPTGITENPVLSLPYHIFTLTQESYHKEAIQNAWGAAFVLLIIVFALSFCALPFRLKTHEEAKVL